MMVDVADEGWNIDEVLSIPVPTAEEIRAPLEREIAFFKKQYDDLSKHTLKVEHQNVCLQEQVYILKEEAFEADTKLRSMTTEILRLARKFVRDLHAQVGFRLETIVDLPDLPDSAQDANKVEV